ncbi:pzh1, partial [[Candida] subhashii]
MGSSTSKQSSSSNLKIPPPLQRTDTSNSTKSTRSIRSKLSLSSINDNNNNNNHDNNNSNTGTPRILSRKNSTSSYHTTTSTTDDINGPPIINNNNNNNDLPNGTNGQTTISHNNSYSNFQTSFNNKLPPSMIQIPPKEPILLRRNTNDTINTSISVESPLLSSSVNNINNNGNNNNISRTSTNHSIPSLSGTSPLAISSSPMVSSTTNTPNTTTVSTPTQEYDQKSIHSRTSSMGDLAELSKTSSISRNIINKSTTNTSISNNAYTIDIEDLIQRLLDAGYSGKRTKNVCLKNTEIQLICATAREIFLSQPSLLELSPPVKVVGDVHGQYGDLIRIFTK